MGVLILIHIKCFGRAQPPFVEGCRWNRVSVAVPFFYRFTGIHYLGKLLTVVKHYMTTPKQT